jgi:hypothetical protein
LDALENDNADAVEGGEGDDSEYELEEAEGEHETKTLPHPTISYTY